MAPWLRSTLAVLAGFVVYVAIAALGGWLCSRFLDVHADRPNITYFATSTAYYFVAAIAGGYLAAVLGRRNPVSHGVGLAMLIFGVNVINLVTKFDSVHRMYVLLINIGVPLMAILGAFLRRGHTEGLPARRA